MTSITHNPRESRFEATVDARLCIAEYRLQDDTMLMTHTEVPSALEGRGIGKALVQAALAHAREHGLKVAAECPFVRSYLQRHPQDGVSV